MSVSPFVSRFARRKNWVGGNMTAESVDEDVRNLRQQLRISNNIIAYANVKDFGALGNGTADDTAPIQAAIDSNCIVYFPPGDYLATGLLLNSAYTGYYLFGSTQSETTSRGTRLINSGTGALFASSGGSTFSYLNVERMSFTQSSSSKGDIFSISNVAIMTNFEQIEFDLLNKSSHFYFGSDNTSGHVKFKSIRGYMASESNVPAILMSTSSGEVIFACLFSDMLINAHDNSTAPMILLENRDNGVSGYTKFERCVFEVPGGGAVEINSMGNVIFENCDTADLAGAPAGPLFNIGKSSFSSLLSTDITFIGCFISGGTAAQPDIRLGATAGQASLVLINTTAPYLESQTHPIIKIGGTYGTTAIGTTVLTEIGYDARVTGVASISGTNTKATNLRGSATFSTSNTKTISFATTEPDASYHIVLTGNANESFYVESGSKSTTQFIARSSNATSTATVDWVLIR